MDKFDGFKFSSKEEQDDIDTVLKRFEEFCMGTTHEAFESYHFHVRVQEPNESIDAYVAELRKLTRVCNFEAFEDRMIRDRILVGCKTDHVREKLLEDPKLDLKKAIDIARAYGASQVKLNEMKELAVDRVMSKDRKKLFPEEKKQFSKYLVGLPKFVIETDHKPLLSLMKAKDLDFLTPRIQRFRMRMLRFTYDIEYVAGKDLVTADSLSRSPLKNNKAEEETVEVSTIFQSIPISDERLEEVRRAQQRDKECREVIQFTQGHWPQRTHGILKLYYAERHCLAVEQDILLHGCRLAIPSSLRQDMLQRIHQGHQGIVKCRALACTCIWWPGMSKGIETLVNNCPECEKHIVLPPQPLVPTPTPDHPWKKVGSDLFEWQGEHYLLVVDYYSRWIEIPHLSSLTSKSVINSFKAIFARMGIPRTVLTDNGT
ncbi:uncharacterized protein K02A2.6-like [Aplysia californica]|uniref:Uncharacterized protein K02A2.6-like n=1 Tax=Aplysia californica TaxID=6500 RepID=A0ABM1AEH7_APLCA|nr:uncharacterized protein K02A2.6-like [Aplysia californica]